MECQSWSPKKYLPAPQSALGSSGPNDQVCSTGSNTSTELTQCSGNNSFLHLVLIEELPPVNSTVKKVTSREFYCRVAGKWDLQRKPPPTGPLTDAHPKTLAGEVRKRGPPTCFTVWFNPWHLTCGQIKHDRFKRISLTTKTYIWGGPGTPHYTDDYLT